jgi:hypothetical protein
MVKGADRRCKLGLELKRSAEEGNVTKVEEAAQHRAATYIHIWTTTL